MADKHVSKTSEGENGEGQWVIDTEDIRTMKPIFEWNRVMASNNMDAARKAMMARIKQWPFEGDPANVESWENLTPKQWTETLTKCGDAVGCVFQESGN